MKLIFSYHNFLKCKGRKGLINSSIWGASPSSKQTIWLGRKFGKILLRIPLHIDTSLLTDLLWNRFSKFFCLLGFQFLPYCYIRRDFVQFKYLVNIKNLKSNHGGVIPLIACNFTKSSIPPYVFLTFSLLYEL